jgi:hypothetical protein
MALEIGVVHAALRQNVRDGMTHDLADPQLTLRAAGGGIFFVVVGHGPNPVCRHHPRRRMIQYSASKDAPGLLDAPAEPVIGLAEGETRWRGMTAY